MSNSDCKDDWRWLNLVRTRVGWLKKVNQKNQWKNEVLQIMRKTLIWKKKEKQEQEDCQEESRKERSNEMVPFQGGGNLIFQD